MGRLSTTECTYLPTSYLSVQREIGARYFMGKEIWGRQLTTRGG